MESQHLKNKFNPKWKVSKMMQIMNLELHENFSVGRNKDQCLLF